jgi:hypothetical protein
MSTRTRLCGDAEEVQQPKALHVTAIEDALEVHQCSNDRPSIPPMSTGLSTLPARSTSLLRSGETIKEASNSFSRTMSLKISKILEHAGDAKIFLGKLKQEDYNEVDLSVTRSGRVLTNDNSRVMGWIKQIISILKGWMRENKELQLYSSHKELLQEDDASHEVESFRELIFDLVFVVSFIELSKFLSSFVDTSSSNTTARIFFTFMIFTTFWLNWYHTNYVLSILRLRGPWLMLFPVVMYGTLSLSAHIREGENVEVSIFSKESLRVAAAIFMVLPRLCFAIIWLNIVFFRSEHKHGDEPSDGGNKMQRSILPISSTPKMWSSKRAGLSKAEQRRGQRRIAMFHLIVFCVSVLLCIATALTETVTSRAIWILMIIIELLVLLNLNSSSSSYMYTL